MFGKKKDKPEEQSGDGLFQEAWARDAEREKRRFRLSMERAIKRGEEQAKIHKAEVRRDRRDKIAAEIMARYRMADDFDGNPAADALRDAELLLQELERTEDAAREAEKAKAAEETIPDIPNTDIIKSDDAAVQNQEGGR